MNNFPKHSNFAVALSQISYETAVGTAIVGAATLLHVQFYEGNLPPWLGATTVAAIAVGLLLHDTLYARGTDSSQARQAATRGEYRLAGWDIPFGFLATPVALGGGVLLALWGVGQACAGQMPGNVGTLLVLLLIGVTAMKLAAEMYLFSWLSVGDTEGVGAQREQAAQLLAGPLSGWTKARFALGALGGIVLPLGAQILAAGAKNIPPAVVATPSAISAVLAIACLLPSELIARWLYYQAVADNEATAKPLSDQ